MSALAHYGKLFWAKMLLSLMAAATHRVNFALMLLQNALNGAIELGAILAIYIHVDRIGTWSRPQMVLLIAFSQLTNYLYRGLVQPNLLRFAQSLRTGEFDFVLLRPISPMFESLLGTADWMSLLSIWMPIALIACAAPALQPTPIQVLAATGLGLAGLACTGALMLMVYGLTSALDGHEGLETIYHAFMQVANRPASAFQPLFGPFTRLLPFFLVANAPVASLSGRLDPIEATTAVALAALFIGLCAFGWRIGLARYEGASH